MTSVTRSSIPVAEGRRPARPVLAFFIVLAWLARRPSWVAPGGAIAPLRIVE
jgi:hypothetical protein